MQDCIERLFRFSHPWRLLSDPRGSFMASFPPFPPRLKTKCLCWGKNPDIAQSFSPSKLEPVTRGGGSFLGWPKSPAAAAMAVTRPSTRKFLYDFSLWYCLEDDPIATSVGEILTQQGFRGYIEHQDQVAGRSVIASAAEAVETSRVAIVLLTARSVADPWCQRVAEWNLLRTIQEEGTKVIPVYVDVSRDDVPLALRHLNGLEYGSGFFQERLLQSLRKARPHARAQHPTSVASAQGRVRF